jgi:hypothetical protein
VQYNLCFCLTVSLLLYHTRAVNLQYFINTEPLRINQMAPNISGTTKGLTTKIHILFDERLQSVTLHCVRLVLPVTFL